MNSIFPEPLSKSDYSAFAQLEQITACEEKSAYHQLQRYATDLQQTLRERELAYQQLYAYVTDLQRALMDRNRALAEAKAASGAKSRLIANMSHEFRTPLTAILGFSELLAEKVDQSAQRDLLRRILAAGKRIDGLVENLLTLTRIDTGSLSISLQPCDLSELLREESKPFAERARVRGLRLDVLLPGFQVEPVALDEARVRQAIAALLDNAVKFTAHGSVTVSLHADPDSRLPLRIDISDTGIGISADDQARVMNSFEQADGSGTRAYEGAGLGLAVAGSLLALIGCQLSLQSEAGRGSTFSILLPPAS